jgi:hypothetical protein
MSIQDEGAEWRPSVMFLVAGGQGERVYVGYTVVDGQGEWNQNYCNLTDPSRGEEPETRLAGGQQTPLPAKWWVTKEQAFKALKYFLMTGATDPSQVWEPSFRS